MDWVSEHLQLIIAIAGGVAWWLNHRRQGQVEPDEPEEQKSFEDPELAERTRRIREEIQRKIQQRSRGLPPSSDDSLPDPAALPPIGPETLPPIMPPILQDVLRRQPVAPNPARTGNSHLEAQRAAEILEQQTALMERLRQAQELKAAAVRRIQFEAETANKEEAAVAAVRSALGEDLRNTASLRRAFLLREVLGPPVALR